YVLAADTIQHAEVKVADRSGGVFHEAAGREGAAAAARKNDREVVVRVAIAVGVAAAIDDHRVVQERIAIDILGVFHFGEEVSELLDVPMVDRGHFLDRRRNVAVMREGVMAFRNSYLSEVAIAAVACDHEGGDAG